MASLFRIQNEIELIMQWYEFCIQKGFFEQNKEKLVNKYKFVIVTFADKMHATKLSIAILKVACAQRTNSK